MFFGCRFFPPGIGIAKDDHIGASHVYCCMITIVYDFERLCAGYGCWDGIVCIVLFEWIGLAVEMADGKWRWPTGMKVVD